MIEPPVPELNDEIADFNCAAAPAGNPAAASPAKAFTPSGSFGNARPFIAADCASLIRPEIFSAPGIALIAPTALLSTAPTVFIPPGRLLNPDASVDAVAAAAPDCTCEAAEAKDFNPATPAIVDAAPATAFTEFTAPAIDFATLFD